MMKTREDNNHTVTRSNYFLAARKKKVSLFCLTYVVVLFVIYLQFRNILGVPIKISMPQISYAIFIADKIVIISLLIIIYYTRLFVKPMLSEHYVNGISKSELIMLFPLTLFVFWNLISSAMNQNSLITSLNGTFAYVGYFLVYFIFSSYSFDQSIIKKIYQLLLGAALFISIISIGQEILAFVYPESATWWPNIQTGNDLWRFGFFRAPSILGHPNVVGLFLLFFITIELARKKHQSNNRLNIIILGLAILFTLSRVAMGGLLIAYILLYWIQKKWKYLSFAVFLLLVIFSFGILASPDDNRLKDIPQYDEYRDFVKAKSLNIITDHPLWGVGPGMYGGHVSIKYNSPVYQEYKFEGEYYDYLHEKVLSIEQQWLQILAELGIPGLFLFVVLMLTPSFILMRLLRSNNDIFTRSMIEGLIIVPVQIIFYMSGYTITEQPELLVLFFAFTGMLVGNQRNMIKNMTASSLRIQSK